MGVGPGQGRGRTTTRAGHGPRARSPDVVTASPVTGPRTGARRRTTGLRLGRTGYSRHRRGRRLCPSGLRVPDGKDEGGGGAPGLGCGDWNPPRSSSTTFVDSAPASRTFRGCDLCHERSRGTRSSRSTGRCDDFFDKCQCLSLDVVPSQLPPHSDLPDTRVCPHPCSWCRRPRPPFAPRCTGVAAREDSGKSVVDRPHPSGGPPS